MYWINLRKAQDKGYTFWQTRSHAIIFYDSVQPLAFVSRTSTPRPPPKIVLREAWQVKHDKELQQQTSIEKSITGQENPFTVDFLVQGTPQKAVLEDRERTTRIRKLAHSQNPSRTDALSTFSEESKRTIHSWGKIELFELGEVYAKTQCSSCAKYWPEGTLYCTCGLCSLPSDKQRRKT